MKFLPSRVKGKVASFRPLLVASFKVASFASFMIKIEGILKLIEVKENSPGRQAIPG